MTTSTAKISLRWVLIGYLAAILLCVAWKIRFVIAANMTPGGPLSATTFIDSTALNDVDEKIISDAIDLIENATHLTQNDDEFCVSGRPLTLFCALAISAKINGENISPEHGYTLRVANAIEHAVKDRPDYPALATQRFAVISQFNNQPSTDRKAALAVLKSALAPGIPE